MPHSRHCHYAGARGCVSLYFCILCFYELFPEIKTCDDDDDDDDDDYKKQIAAFNAQSYGAQKKTTYIRNYNSFYSGPFFQNIIYTATTGERESTVIFQYHLTILS